MIYDLLEIRERLRYEDKQAAAVGTGLTRQYIRMIELGHRKNPTYNTMKKLSDYLMGMPPTTTTITPAPGDAS